jgi:hypothetical protein
MKSLSIIFLIFISTNGICQKTNPFAKLKYDKVILYNFTPNQNNASIIEADGKLTDAIRKKIVIEQSFVNLLNKKLGQRSSFGGGTRNCFLPHEGIVYYLADTAIAYINICLDCNRIFSNIPIIGKKVGQVFRGPSSYYLSDDGMSNSFRNFLKILINKNEQ